MTTPAAILAPHVTKDNAAAYMATSEKWTFCTDILDACDLPRAESLVTYLEDSFDNLNKETTK